MHNTSPAEPLVTVVVATYNRAETLRYAIESILWQTFKNFEVWIVGDACTDHTEKVVKSFTDPRINWYNLPKNSGYQSKPNNEGIKRARGKYIAYLNHDDIWLPNHLEALVNHIEKTQAHFAFSIIQWVYSFTYSRPDIPLLPDMPIPPEATAVIHRKDVVNEIGYWKNINETYSYPRVDFFRQAQYKGMKFEIVPSVTGLKFLWDEKNYHDVGPQPLYMERLRNEPEFINRELSAMLIRAEYSINSFPKGKRLIWIFTNPLRKMMLKMKMDPAMLKFWNKKGKQIRIWRKRHGLKENVEDSSVNNTAIPTSHITVKKEPSLQN
ncbi:glycosyltransferase family 2 protein [Chryseosolibacter indicus]|uniref:Glycosyltransferase family 2 protein n=1 Tax=Chryseosolibacter indicus TaxID=2782351 RepID=A0ABS5VJX5_9BACT|nr:glycosyltransferase family 2 protein [Chryseosolibacter indicus]MBT1701732.1 glycosyltransferase family 2 protein [Chryseosolibacter indicus]